MSPLQCDGWVAVTRPNERRRPSCFPERRFLTIIAIFGPKEFRSANHVGGASFRSFYPGRVQVCTSFLSSLRSVLIHTPAQDGIMDLGCASISMRERIRFFLGKNTEPFDRATARVNSSCELEALQQTQTQRRLQQGPYCARLIAQ